MNINIGSVGQLSQAKTNKEVQLSQAKTNKEVQLSQAKINKEVTRFEEKEVTTLSLISCKITPFTPNPDQNLHIFLRVNNIKYTISEAMTDLWPYGRVIRTSTGFHGEFFRKNDDLMSLMFLGKEREDAIHLMYRIVSQNIAIDMMTC